MNVIKRNKIISIAAVLTLFLVVSIGWGIAQEQSSMVYHACVNNSSGTIKVWQEPQPCSANEFAIEWNSEGPQGPQGEPGPQGEQGPAGDTSALEARVTDLDNRLLVLEANCPTDPNAEAMPGVNWSGCDLFDANLFYADLSGAALVRANLRSAHLNGANLTRANLVGAFLYYAVLYDADLTGADLTGAVLTGANWGNTTCPDGTNSEGNWHCGY